MARQDVNPAALHPAPGFSHVSVALGSRLVYFARQLALDREFGIVWDDCLGVGARTLLRRS